MKTWILPLWRRPPHSISILSETIRDRKKSDNAQQSSDRNKRGAVAEFQNGSIDFIGAITIAHRRSMRASTSIERRQFHDIRGVLQFFAAPPVFRPDNFQLPNDHALGRHQVHTIGLLDVEGGIPFREVSGRHIGTQAARAVKVHLKQHLVFRLCLIFLCEQDPCFPAI